MEYKDSKECSVYGWPDMLRKGDRISSILKSNSTRSVMNTSDWVGGTWHNDFAPIAPPFSRTHAKKHTANAMKMVEKNDNTTRSHRDKARSYPNEHAER